VARGRCGLSFLASFFSWLPPHVWCALPGLLRRAQEFEDAIHENPTRGAMMLGVCRGKVGAGR